MRAVEILPPSFLPMSEDSSPKKKTVRKSARKKTAKKATSRDSVAEELTQEQTLPLVSVNDSPIPESPDSSKKEDQERRPSREPKKGVRDRRREPRQDDGERDVSNQDSNQSEQAGDAPAARDSDSGGDDHDGRGRGKGRGRGGRGRRGDESQPKARTPIDENQLQKKAWKIYLSEVTEEGLALLDDNGLRSFARGSFQAARVFLEEEQRHGK